MDDCDTRAGDGTVRVMHRRLLLLASTAAVALPPAAGAAPYAECAYQGSQLRELHQRVLTLQSAIDVATTARAEKRLRKKLRKLRAHERQINAWLNAECNPPDDYPAG